MPNPKLRKTYLQNDCNSVDILRALSRSIDTLEPGPRTTGERVWLGFCRFVRRELSCIGMEVRKLLLILIFNFAAVFVFFWLLSLL